MDVQAVVNLNTGFPGNTGLFSRDDLKVWLDQTGVTTDSTASQRVADSVIFVSHNKTFDPEPPHDLSEPGNVITVMMMHIL